MAEVIHRREEAGTQKYLDANDYRLFARYVERCGLFGGRPATEYLQRRDMATILGDARPLPGQRERLLDARELVLAFDETGRVTAETVFKTGWDYDNDADVVTTLGEALHGGVTVEQVDAELRALRAAAPRMTSCMLVTTYAIREDGSLVETFETRYAGPDGEERTECRPSTVYRPCERSTEAWRALMGDVLVRLWREESRPLREGDDPLRIDGTDVALQMSNGHVVGMSNSEWGGLKGPQ